MLLEPVAGPMGSVAEVHVTSASRWSVRGQLLRILHAGPAAGNSSSTVAAKGTTPGASSASAGANASGISSTSGAGQRAASPAASCAPPALAPQQQHQQDATEGYASSSVADTAAPGCSSCGAAQPCSGSSVAGSAAAHAVTSGIRTDRSDASTGGMDSSGRQLPCLTDASAEATAAEALMPVSTAMDGAQPLVKAPTATTAAKASLQRHAASAVHRTEPADLLLYVGVVLGLSGVLVSGVLTLLQTLRE